MRPAKTLSLEADPKPLPRSFFARGAEAVARDLVGTHLVHIVDGEALVARIVETEAYVGPHDLACHAAKGRTKRTEIMFGPAGHAYVYLCYGIHQLFNVVTGAPGHPEAVLIRAGEPVARSGSLRGPGLFAKGLRIDRRHYGLDVTQAPLFFTEGTAPARITTTTRVGVDYAGPWKDAPLRFYDAGSPQVSRR